MASCKLPSIDEIVDFHGHICPGLVLGYRAALLAFDWLEDHYSEGEELVTIVENRACGIDAIQYLLGTTVCMGNFFIRDYGKHVYTFANRTNGEALRIAAKTGARWDKEIETREELVNRLLTISNDELFEVSNVIVELPPKAELPQLVICDSCNEPAMETKVRLYKGKKLCIPCFNKEGGSD